MKYKFRSGADHGILFSLLLPLCLLPFAVISNSEVIKLVFALNVVLPFSYFLKETNWRWMKYGFWNNIFFHCLLALPVSCFLSWNLLSQFGSTYVLCFALIWYHNILTTNMLMNCPGSFTIGESQIISQTFILFILFTIIPVLIKAGVLFDISEKPLLESTRFLQVLFTCSILYIQYLSKVSNLKFGRNLVLLFISYICFLFSMWNFYLQQNPVFWLLNFCTWNTIRVNLIAFWLFCSSSSIIFVILFNKYPRKNNLTIVRKYFHFVIDVVFISGFIWDSELLYLASGIILVVFILLEVCRLTKVPLIGTEIGEAFMVFLDEKDSGKLILTHIYLLVGCSFPVWLYYFTEGKKGYHICQMSGIISVGFGDTAAALCGSSFGKHFWKGSKKTIEGTVAAILIQLGSAFLFLQLGHEISLENVLFVASAVILTSILEAKTTQIDNLILPLFMFTFLGWVS